MPDISKITLPSGNTYDIKDSVARQLISGGISFVIGWSKANYESSSLSSTDNVPSGVTVYYNNGEDSALGDLLPSSATIGSFYLLYSTTHTTGSTLDKYDEYVTYLGDEYWLTYTRPADWLTNYTSYYTKSGNEYIAVPSGSVSPVWTSGTYYSKYAWEKIGDTQVDLSDVVTDITYTKSTADVIGADATFTVTQPTIALSTGATAGTGVVSVATGVTSVSDVVTDIAFGDHALNGSKPVVSVLSKTKISGSASGGNVAWNSKDQVTAVTGVSASKKKLTTTSVIGVTSNTTTASKATAGTSQTTLKNTSTTSTTNTDWLKGISVSNEILTIGAATPDTQTTTQFTFDDVTVPVKDTTATTVATGGLSDTTVTTNVGDTIAIDASASGTDTVIGTDSTFTVTQPSVTISSDSTTGDIEVTTGASQMYYISTTKSAPTVTLTTTNLAATASGANTAWNNKDEVTVLDNYTVVSPVYGNSGS